MMDVETSRTQLGIRTGLIQAFGSRTFWLLLLVILAIFVGRALLARQGNPPRLNDLFTLIVLLGSLGVVIRGHQVLHPWDWAAALGTGAIVAVTMLTATLFDPYPFLGMAGGNGAQAAIRGMVTAAAALGGLVIFRWGGPVRVRSRTGEKPAAFWKSAPGSLAFGVLTGLPLAVLNAYALSFTQGQPFRWQNPLASLVDALQPGIVEEVVYRFAFLGLVWLALRRSSPLRAGQHAGWLAGLLALLVHTFMHYDSLYLEAPLVALGMGILTGILWGLPMTLLALRRDLESAIAFHWVQDVARFLVGF